MLCPLAKSFILCLVPVQPRKKEKYPDIAEKLLTGMYNLSIILKQIILLNRASL